MPRPDARRAETAGCAAALIALLALAPAPRSRADDVPDGETPVVIDIEQPGDAPDDDDDADDDAIPVGDVLVTATRAERPVEDVAGFVTVIDREQIESSGVANLPDLLRRQAGLFVTNNTSNLAGYSIDARGFNNGGGNGGNLLVQIDGRRANEPDSDSTDWALIPLDQVETIEIVRGAASALYGDNATGGVINIRTRASEGPPRGIVKGSGGSWQTGGGSLSTAGSFGPATAALFIEGVSSDGYRDQSAFSAMNYNGSFEWSFLDRVLVGIRGGYHRDWREFPGALSEADAEVDRRAANPDNAGDEGDVESGFIHGWIEAALSEQIELKIQPYYRPRADDAAFTSIAFGDTLVSSDKDSVGVDAQLQVDLPIGELPNRLIVGMEYLHDERSSSSNSTDFSGTCTTPRTTTFTNSQRDVYAGFLQDELRVHEQVILSAGVRFDHATLDVAASNPDPGCPGFERGTPDFSVWSPRASITWRPTSAISVYGAYSRGFRIPSLDEASPLVFPGFVSLPNLDAQTSNGGEIGAKFRNQRFDASVSFYLLMVDDEILFDPIFFDNFNLDLVRHRGIETSFSVEVFPWLQLYGNYTFDDVEIREADNPALVGSRMPITPRHRGTAGVFAPLPYSLEFRANANFVGDRLVANDFGQGGGTLEPLDFYATLDLLLAWRPRIGEHLGFAITAAARNVNDAEFDDFGVRGFSGRFLYPAATRSWEVGFEVSYRL